MSMELMILILLIALIVVCAGVVISALAMFWQTHRMLMYFHNAGGKLADREVQKAKLALDTEEMKVRRMEAEANKVRADAERIKAQKQLSDTGVRGSPTGGSPQVLSVGDSMPSPRYAGS